MFDHPLAEGQEKSEFAKQIQELFLAFAQILGQISSFSRHFLETLTETGSIHWVGVQTWLQSTHEGKR